MMKFHNIILVLICFTLFSFKTHTRKHEKTKTIHKEYVVNEDATVYVNNKYGNIYISTWDENKVDISVKITVKGNDLDKVEEKLNGIRVNFEGSKDLVEARTKIENTKTGWSWWGNSSKVNYKINYFIKIPKLNNADLHNKYGNIELNELIGKTNIRCDYGNVIADKLLNKTNLIELNYSGNSEFEYINNANINADYSKITINKCKKIKSNMDYTTLSIGSVEDVSFNSDYGNISISEANNVIGNSDYASMKFGVINNSLDINTNYGGLRVKNLADNFEKVIVDGNYAGIKIGTSPNNNFNFDININYASFQYPEEKITLTKSSKKVTKKYYNGSFGKNKEDSSIQIKSNYGSVSFTIND